MGGVAIKQIREKNVVRFDEHNSEKRIRDGEDIRRRNLYSRTPKSNYDLSSTSGSWIWIWITLQCQKGKELIKNASDFGILLV